MKRGLSRDWGTRQFELRCDHAGEHEIERHHVALAVGPDARRELAPQPLHDLRRHSRELGRCRDAAGAQPGRELLSARKREPKASNQDARTFISAAVSCRSIESISGSENGIDVNRITMRWGRAVGYARSC